MRELLLSLYRSPAGDLCNLILTDPTEQFDLLEKEIKLIDTRKSCQHAVFKH